jgi:dethiobiotin synthetase
MRGWFITGTDTGVGKTVVAAAVAASLRRRGCRVRVHKPLLTGLDTAADPVWPPDHELLARAAGCAPAQVVEATWGPAVSPHLAAQMSGVPAPSNANLAAAIAARSTPGAVTIVEGVGGLLVPLGLGQDVRGLAGELDLPLIVVARPGLGTINHTLLTLEAARSTGLAIAGVVLTPWPTAPDIMLRSNAETIQRGGEVEVATLAALPAPDVESLADAGDRLPLMGWLDGQML